MKHTGDEHRENHAPQPGPDGEGARSPVDEEFDIDALFRSEDEIGLAKTTASGDESHVRPNPELIPADRSESPSPQVAAAAPEPAGEISVGVNPEPIADDVSAVPSLSIADLIDNHVRLEWYEAVAIARHLCHLMARDPAANLHRSLVEPWNVEITNAGEVQVLPGGSSSDPLVKQVGRVLRVLLQDLIAPAELRLVASQAAFDVPVYSSVDELSAALRHFERSGESESIRAAFMRGRQAKLSVAQTPSHALATAWPQAIDQTETRKSAPTTALVASRTSSKSVSPRTFAAAAVIAVVGMLAVAAAVVTSRWILSPEERPGTLVQEPPRPQNEAPRSASSQKRSYRPEPSLPPARLPAERPAGNAVAPAASRRVAEPLVGAPGVSRSPTPDRRGAAPAVALGDSTDSNEHHANELLASGRADEAAMSFDAIVLKNPFYQPDLSRMSPESLSAFRNSKRTILPPMVRRHYQDARAAFDVGDLSLAITEGEQARALLRDLDELDISVEAGDVVADLRNLLTLASAARSAEEERVFTIEDSGVTPPRPLGRQLSAASMSHISLRPTGRLEILVGRSGRVEAVKLNTPGNGYHDRMLVSAVKAWHYKPAVRNGRAVRFSLVMSIVLPDL